MDVSPLPIDAALPDLTAALRGNNAAVLVAPPGAGKTTRVPLVLAREDWAQKAEKKRRILVLEPRRIAARAAALLGDARVIASEGRAFAVETRYVGRDARPIEPQVADAIIRAMRADAGSLLAFLPGAAEIRRTKTLLEGRTEPATDVVALYGALTGDEQDRAIA